MLGRLRSPLLREALTHAEPAGAVRGFRPKPSARHHYHRHSPDGLVVIGDANTSVNPVYGQGLTVAAFGAQALARAVATHDGIGHAAARAARRDIHTASAQAWLISGAEDARFPSTVGGPSNVLVKAQHRFLDRALARASTDPRVAKAFHDTMSMVSPAALLRPTVLSSVLLGARWHAHHYDTCWAAAGFAVPRRVPVQRRRVAPARGRRRGHPCPDRAPPALHPHRRPGRRRRGRNVPHSKQLWAGDLWRSD